MTDQRSWFSTFNPIPEGSWNVAVADNCKLPVRGTSDIRIIRQIDGVDKEGILEGVLYVPELKRNLFSIGLANEKGLSFTTKSGRCEFHHAQGTGPKVLEGVCHGKLYILSFQVVPSVTEACLVESTSFSAVKQDALIWHKRMAHVNPQTMKKMFEGASVSNPPLTSFENFPTVCEGCALGKQHKATYRSDPNKQRSLVPGEFLHADLSGRASIPSLGNSLYYVLIKDDASSFRFVHFVQFKNEAIKFFRKILRVVQRDTGVSVCKFRSDGGKEFCNKFFDELLDTEGIRRDMSTPYTPQQNGYIERDNRTVCEAARSMMVAMNLPEPLWAEAVNNAVHVLNRTINTQTGTKTPFELWYGKKPSIDHYRVFGSIAYILTDKKHKTKFQARGRQVRFVGYSSTSKGWRFWDPTSQKIVESSDVIFDEQSDKFYADETRQISQFVTFELSTPVTNLPGLTIPPLPDPDVLSDSDLPENPSSSHDTTSQTSVSVGVSLPQPDVPNRMSQPVAPRQPPTTSDNQDDHGDPLHPRFTTLCDLYLNTEVLHPIYKLSPEQVEERQSHAMLITTGEECHEPQTYKEAVASDHAADWQQAMKREYDSLIDNRTWDLVTLPSDRKKVQCKWVFKVKYKSSGEIDRFKARVVAKAYSQKPGIDYQETYSPVVKHSSIRVIFAIAAAKKMHLMQFDIGTAFLNGDLNEDIYMSQPEGFVTPGCKKLVCKLKKSLYGLKQSARQWNIKFDTFLKTYNLIPSEADPCVYHDNGMNLLLGIFIDDGIAASGDTKRLTAVISYLETIFKVVKGAMDYYVGFQVHIEPDTHAITLHQTRYIVDVLKRFGMMDSHPVSTPFDHHVVLSACAGADDAEFNGPYQQAIGCLMYAMVLTRDDITYAVTKCAQYSKKPRLSHWSAVKRVMRYLRGTLDYGIRFHGSEKDLQVIGYVDADYSGDTDDRKSRTGIIFKMANGPISWSSQRQGCTSDSTTEAEFVALAEAAKEAIWLRRLLASLGLRQSVPTPIFCDNQSAIRLVKNPEFHKRTKHIERKYYFSREKFEKGDIDVKYVSTKSQLADIFTKGLPKDQFTTLRNLIGMTTLH